MSNVYTVYKLNNVYKYYVFNEPSLSTYNWLLRERDFHVHTCTMYMINRVLLLFHDMIFSMTYLMWTKYCLYCLIFFEALLRGPCLYPINLKFLCTWYFIIHMYTDTQTCTVVHVTYIFIRLQNHGSCVFRTMKRPFFIIFNSIYVHVSF